MGIYLYCFTPEDATPGLDLAGISGEPVSSLSYPNLSLWVDLPNAAPRATLESVRAHHTVVRTAWSRSAACLPARFGQWFAERDALEKALLDKWPALERALGQVQGAGEHGIRILDPEGTEPEEESDAESGRAYLESLRRRTLSREERNRRAEALGRELETALDGIVRAQRTEPLLTSHGLLSVSHLVPNDQQDAYAELVARFREGNPKLRFLTSGPWPPYSFAP